MNRCCPKGVGRRRRDGYPEASYDRRALGRHIFGRNVWRTRCAALLREGGGARLVPSGGTPALRVLEIRSVSNAVGKVDEETLSLTDSTRLRVSLSSLVFVSHRGKCCA